MEFSNSDYDIDYQYILSHTGSGPIVRGIHLPTKTPVAVRMVMKKWWNEEIEKQIEIEKKTRHPNIIKFYDVLYYPKSNLIVLELAEGGSLGDMLSTEEILPIAKIREIAEMLWSVCRYLSKNNAMVLDLWPGSIVICKDPINEESIYKITNVGLTRVLSQNHPNYVNPGLKYQAPEVLVPDGNKSKADLWSIGIILYELFFRKFPFPDENNLDPSTIDYSGMPETLKELIQKLIVKDVGKRLNFSQFMGLSFFNVEDDEHFNYSPQKSDEGSSNEEKKVKSKPSDTNLGEKWINYCKQKEQAEQESQTLSETIANCGIIRINFDFCFLRTDILSILIDGITINSTLETINLSGNCISDDIASKLGNGLKNKNNLKKLFLYRNLIGDDGITDIAQALKGKTEIREILLGKNMIGNNGAKALSSSLHFMINLERFGIENNQIQDEGAFRIFSALENKKVLTSIYFGSNPCSKIINIKFKGAFGKILK